MPIGLAKEVALAKNMMELSLVFVLPTGQEIDAKELLTQRESRLVESQILSNVLGSVFRTLIELGIRLFSSPTLI